MNGTHLLTEKQKKAIDQHFQWNTDKTILQFARLRDGGFMQRSLVEAGICYENGVATKFGVRVYEELTGDTGVSRAEMRQRLTDMASGVPMECERRAVTRQRLVEMAGGDLIFLEGPEFDDAIVGLDYDGYRLIYDEHHIRTILERDGMTAEEAQEYFDFNVAGLRGERFPLYITATKDIT